MASTSAAINRPPAFIFSYNASDPDILALSGSAHRHHFGLGTQSRSRTTTRGDDDHVPVYGPTTYRRGPLRFVPARQPQFGVIPGSDDGSGQPITDLKGKGRAVEPKDDDDDELDVKPSDLSPPSAAVADRVTPTAHPRPSTSSSLSGSTVRGLYAGIVGISTSSSSSSAPASVRASLAPDPDPDPPERSSSAAPLQRETAVEVHMDGDEGEDDVLVLSSDEEDSGDGALEEEEEDDDLVVVDPLTGLPEARRTSTSTAHAPRRPQPLLIHQLLPPSSSASSAQPPTSAAPGVVPLPPSTPHYALPSTSPGFRMLVAQGWRLGAALGPEAPPGETQRGLRVPLRAREKFDRAGLGGGAGGVEEGRRLSGRERDERRKEWEREERERRKGRDGKGGAGGRGARAMERQRREDERVRRAMIGYMNR